MSDEAVSTGPETIATPRSTAGTRAERLGNVNRKRMPVSAIQILGLDHVVLRVRDLERSIAFYTAVLGATEERRLDGPGLVQLRIGAHLIDLVPVDSELGRMGGAGPGEGGRNLDHFAVEISAFDETRLRAQLEAHGVAPGEVARRYGARGYGPSMYIRDPDGNVVELKGPSEEAGGA